MARIDIGIGTSHAPQLSTAPEDWEQRATADQRNEALAFRGKDYTFEELRDARGAAFGDQCDLEAMRERYARCRSAVEGLGKILRDSDVDVLVIVSSDHKEVFTDEFLAPFTVYWGETVQHEPLTQEALDAMAPGLAVAEVANVPRVSTARRCHSELALHLVKATSEAGFDPAASQQLPPGKHGDHGIPHGWGFILQQLLGGDTNLPIVPLFVNTFWQPNPPSARRCLDFGVALRAAVESFPDDLSVGVVASGGLSHFVIDEELDRSVLEVFTSGEPADLADIPDDILRAGTSELRNWIVVAGALSGSGLRADVVDYVPAYRTDAGTGCGMAFVSWTRDRVVADTEAAR